MTATKTGGPQKGSREGLTRAQENLLEVRELVVHRNYIVFYRVLEESSTVEILRVRHAAQQL